MTVSMPSASPPPGKPSSTQRRRAPRRGATPTISVVVASCRAPALLDACLGSLRGQCEQMGAQLIVTRSASTGDVGSLAKAYPDVEFIEAPSGASIPELRGIGMAQAAGDIDWMVSVDSTINRAHQHATNAGRVEEPAGRRPVRHTGG